MIAATRPRMSERDKSENTQHLVSPLCYDVPVAGGGPTTLTVAFICLEFIATTTGFFVSGFLLMLLPPLLGPLGLFQKNLLN